MSDSEALIRALERHLEVLQGHLATQNKHLSRLHEMNQQLLAQIVRNERASDIEWMPIDKSKHPRWVKRLQKLNRD